jgi:predicted RND superfamily exporter protein
MLDPRLVLFDGLAPRPLLPRGKAPDSSYRRARDDALRHPLVRGLLLSRDARSTLVSVRLQRGSLSTSETLRIAGQLRDLAKRYEKKGHLQIRLTGALIVQAESVRLVQSDTNRLTAVATVLSVLIALLIFRRLDLTFIVCAAPSAGVLWTLGALGLVGEKINVINTVLPVLVLTVGFTDAVHLVIHLRQGLEQGRTPTEATGAAVRQLVFPCFLTSLTTAIGFGSLVLTGNEVIQRFGLSCAAGTVFAFLAVLSVVPLLGSTRLVKRSIKHTPEQTRSITGVWLGSMITGVLQHRWLLTTIGIALTLLLAITVTELQPNTQLAETLPDQSEAKIALQRLDAQFGGCHSAYIVVDWPASQNAYSQQVQRTIAAAEEVCRDQKSLHHALSIATIARSVPGADHRLIPAESARLFIRPELQRAIIITRFRDRGSAFDKITFGELRRKLRELERQFPGYRFHLTGTSVVIAQDLHRVTEDLATSLGFAALTIFGVLTLAFRSFRLGLICLNPNCFPMLLAACVLVWTGEPLRIASVVVFSIFLGIAVDDTIHAVSRFSQELRTDGDVNAAIQRSFLAVGRALLITTVVLLVAFGSVWMGQLPHNRTFAWLGCTAISAALVGDLVFLPAMLACFMGGEPSKNRQVFSHRGADERSLLDGALRRRSG